VLCHLITTLLIAKVASRSTLSHSVGFAGFTSWLRQIVDRLPSTAFDGKLVPCVLEAAAGLLSAKFWAMAAEGIDAQMTGTSSIDHKRAIEPSRFITFPFSYGMCGIL